MKSLIFIVVFTFLLSACFGQDILVLKNGDEIIAKVSEVTPSEIKYKRFDNQDGPIYTVLKSTVFMIKFENGTKEVIESTAAPVASENGPKATVYFLRKTGYAGSMAGYHVFIDEEEVCKINNGKYITREVAPGKHDFSVQFYGTNSKAKAEKLEINIEPGKTYYIQVTQGGKVMTGDTWCIQITEPEAKELLEKLDKDSDCN